MQFSDTALLDEIRAGSRVAFELLMKRHQALVHRVAFSYTRDSDAALDITQEVFLKAYRKLSGFKGRGPFRAWLLRIAHRECLNWQRSRRRRRDTDELTEANSPVCSPAQEDALYRAEQRRLLMRELARLNERQQQALVLRHFAGLSLAEIAEVLDCSVGVVKSILFRGLEKLRENLESQGSLKHEGLHALSSDDRKAAGR